jgi:RNA polymerase sigma factor (sigma-70 family)
MPVNDSRAVGTAEPGELCLDSELLLLGRSFVTLDQKITELFKAYRESLFRYVFTIVGVTAVAEEIAQEAFIRLYCHLRAGNSVDHHRAWLFRTAHNLALNENNRKQLMSTLVDWDELCRLWLDPAPNPEQQTLQNETFARLQAALGRLSPQQRQCILLRAEGFRHREIGEILEVSKSTVEESLRRAMQKLKAYSNV